MSILIGSGWQLCPKTPTGILNLETALGESGYASMLLTWLAIASSNNIAQGTICTFIDHQIMAFQLHSMQYLMCVKIPFA